MKKTEVEKFRNRVVGHFKTMQTQASYKGWWRSGGCCWNMEN